MPSDRSSPGNLAATCSGLKSFAISASLSPLPESLTEKNTLSEVVMINIVEIYEYGGEQIAVRDFNMLESAVNMPKQMFNGKYLHEDLFVMAAAYLFHIAKNHPFIDGNKRTAVVSALVFLELNGLSLSMEGTLLEEITQNAIRGTASKDDIARAFREYSIPLDDEE